MKLLRQLISCAIAIGCLPAAAAAEATQARSSSQGWRAWEAGGTLCVVDGDAKRESCWPAPPSSIVTDLAEAPTGWIAAGHWVDQGHTDLFLVRGDGHGVEALALPSDPRAARGRPQILADATGLQGLVWLEGARQEILEVRAAEWLDGVWGPTVTISPVGAGSQVAPSVTVLADGRWLAVWTAFDGTDDETVWSLHDRGSWSAPRRLHEDNATPDVTPSVLARGTGALAAWSWLDGSDYRLRIAAFDGGKWRPLAPGTERGVVSPRLLASAGEALVTFSSVVPDAWIALELDGEGLPARRAEAASSSTATPFVDAGPDGVAFDWPIEGARILGRWEGQR